jgi:ABC-type molybdate transport system ATPase subunit
MKSISITSRLNDGLDVPFIYETHSIQHALEIIQNTIELGAEISEVVIK